MWLFTKTFKVALGLICINVFNLLLLLYNFLCFYCFYVIRKLFLSYCSQQYSFITNGVMKRSLQILQAKTVSTIAPSLFSPLSNWLGLLSLKGQGQTSWIIRSLQRAEGLCGSFFWSCRLSSRCFGLKVTSNGQLQSPTSTGRKCSEFTVLFSQKKTGCRSEFINCIKQAVLDMKSAWLYHSSPWDGVREHTHVL